MFPAKKQDRTFKDGRVRLANKSGLRRQAFERAGGKCEALHPVSNTCTVGKTSVTMVMRCYRDAPWDGPLTVRGHLAHKKHGPRRDDTLGGVLWKCADCHLKEHGLRSGKMERGTQK